MIKAKELTRMTMIIQAKAGQVLNALYPDKHLVKGEEFGDKLDTIEGVKPVLTSQDGEHKIVSFESYDDALASVMSHALEGGKVGLAVKKRDWRQWRKAQA